MDLGVGPRFELKTVPKGSLPLKHHLAPARHGHIISVETGAFSAGIQKATGLLDTRPREEWVAYSFDRFIAAIKTRYTPHTRRHVLSHPTTGKTLS